jgi:hypothetical protein
MKALVLILIAIVIFAFAIYLDNMREKRIRKQKKG